MDEPDFDDLEDVAVEDLKANDAIVYLYEESGEIGAGEVVSRCGPDRPKGTPGHCGFHYARVVSYCVQISLQISENRHRVWKLHDSNSTDTE